MTVEAPSRAVLRLPEMYPKQEDAIFTPKRYAAIEASTKAGKTVGCLSWQLSKAWLDDQSHVWVAPIYPQAKIAHSRLKRWLVKMDPAKDIWQSNDSDLYVTLHGRSQILFKGGDRPDSIYGPDYASAVIDEATRCKEEVWHAIRSTTTATKGPVRLIGNVKGRKNWAYQLARKAEAGEQNWHYAKLTAYDAVEGKVLDLEEIEDAKRNLPEHVFRELYLAEPSDDGGNPFDIQHIEACTRDGLAEGPVSVWGVDLAESHDWTVAIGLNAQRQVCAFQRWQSDWRNTTKRLVAMIASIPALVDATGVGKPIVEALQVRCPLVEGFLFTPRSKQELIGGLVAEVHQHGVKFPEGPIVMEMESFEYAVKVSPEGHVKGVQYTAPPGMFDDCVCSLALAVRMSHLRPTPLSLRMSDSDVKDPWAADYDRVMDEDLWEPM